MKTFFTLFIFCVTALSVFGQDSIPDYGSRRLMDLEIECCIGRQNQLKCVDSLINVTLNAPNYSGQTDPRKIYSDRLRKLAHYHFIAGGICEFRGDFYESFAYYDKMKSYIDTLNQGKTEKEKELIGLITMAIYQKHKFCREIKDKALYNRCDCEQFLLKFEEKDEDIEVITGPTYIEKPEPRDSEE